MFSVCLRSFHSLSETEERSQSVHLHRHREHVQKDGRHVVSLPSGQPRASGVSAGVTELCQCTQS